MRHIQDRLPEPKAEYTLLGFLNNQGGKQGGLSNGVCKKKAGMMGA